MEIPKIIYTKIKEPFVSFCIKSKITANQITIFNHFITLTFGCFFFSRGTHVGFLLGLFVCCVNGFLDYLDGDIARETNTRSDLGIWLDSGFDVIIQNFVMGAIAIGCYKTGMNVFWIVMFLACNAANNFVAFNFNKKFGFNSCDGNEKFRKIMDKKSHPINNFLKSVIDPVNNPTAIMVYTYRYFIFIGAIFNAMILCFIIMTIISNIRGLILFTIYTLVLAGDNRLFVLRALSMCDPDSENFYR